ncbi:hypothetical protein VD659_05670 [Herbiconiux sp. 11R-BC]|uniref:hypothetical protein n=1 Tax=Herbiconiux sp. 11R-BC TaxID=3111637 RepID=UPI003C03B3A6
MTLSPRLDDARVAAVAGAHIQPEPHTAEEIDQMVRLALARGAETVTIGHGDDPNSAAAAKAFATAWRNQGGLVFDTIEWSDAAASWMREARNLIRFYPDMYVLGGAPAGLAQMIRRLVWSTNWAAASTIGFGSAATPTMHQLAGIQYLDGLTGATAAGGTWRIQGAELTQIDPGRDA